MGIIEVTVSVYFLFFILFGTPAEEMDIVQEKNNIHVGGTPPYYEGRDDQIEPNPNH